MHTGHAFHDQRDIRARGLGGAQAEARGPKPGPRESGFVVRDMVSFFLFLLQCIVGLITHNITSGRSLSQLVARRRQLH